MTSRELEPGRQISDNLPGANRDSRLVQLAVASAKEGDPEGLHFLYVRYASDVLRYVASFVHDHHEAEDITQGVFTKLVTAIDEYEQREVPLAAWILRVARHAALDHLRASRTIPTEEVGIADVGLAQTSFDRSRDLRQALEQVRDSQREVLVLRHIVGLSQAETADAIGKTECSIHGLDHRGRRALQANLAELRAAS